jgi:RNA polymerase sigma-70 factor (ECF subfamily)
LRELTEHQRRAVVLHHLCDLSIEDVATETGATVNAVKARLARGRAALAANLGGLREADPAELEEAFDDR